MFTLSIRYTLNPNKLKDFQTYGFMATTDPLLKEFNRYMLATAA